MFTTKFTDLHLHSEYSLQDGMIRVQDSKDPKHIKSEITYRDWETDRKSTRLNSSHSGESRMPSSA